jgi:hypothetical protein
MLAAGGCSTVKNRDLSPIPTPSWKGERLPGQKTKVAVRAAFGGGAQTVHLERAGTISNEVADLLNRGQSPTLTFVPVNQFDRLDWGSYDYVLDLSCKPPPHQSRKNKLILLICYPATVSVIAAPLGLLGLSIPGVVKESADFDWTVSLLQGDEDRPPLQKKQLPTQRALVSATVWSTSEEALRESYSRTESYLKAGVIDFLGGIDWRTLEREYKSTLATGISPAVQPDSGTSSTNYRNRRYVALVIGIDRYQNVNRLQNAVADAQAVARALQSLYGFELHELYDEKATRSGIYSAVREAVSSLREGDNLMIYYAGHGWEDPVLKEGYWVPVEGKEKDQSSFVSNGELKKFICAMEKAQHVLIVADSCFSGSFLRRALGERAIGIRPSNAGTTATEDFFRKMDNRKSRTVLTSGANEPVADGGREGHSVFGYYFLRSLTDPDEKVFTVSELVQRVQKAVASNSRQTPLTGNLEDAGHEDGQMVFCWKAKSAEPAGLPKSAQP